jgi:hypothetical protein
MVCNTRFSPAGQCRREIFSLVENRMAFTKWGAGVLAVGFGDRQYPKNFFCRPLERESGYHGHKLTDFVKALGNRRAEGVNKWFWGRIQVKSCTNEVDYETLERLGR